MASAALFRGIKVVFLFPLQIDRFSSSRRQQLVAGSSTSWCGKELTNIPEDLPRTVDNLPTFNIVVETPRGLEQTRAGLNCV